MVTIFIISGGFVNLYKNILLYTKIEQLKISDSFDMKSNITFQCNKNRFIAHGGGEINGISVTDSLEALNFSYNQGFRYLELDILKTSDGHFVASHDWNSWKKNNGYDAILPPTLEEFKNVKIYKKYTPLDMEAINKWFNEHSDAILVTDHMDEPLKFAKKFIDKNRLMMELFSMNSVYNAIKNNLYGMPTWGVVSQIQGNKLEILKKLGVKFIVANVEVLNQNKQLFKTLSNNGIKIYFYGKYGKNIDFKYFYGRYINDINFIKVCQDG